MKTSFKSIPLALLGASALALQLSASTITWTGVVSSDWDNPDNWDPAQVPAASDHVVINNGSVTVPVSATFATMDWTGGTISGSLAVANTGALNISGDSPKTLYGPLTNAGTVTWSGSGYLQLYNNGGQPYAGAIDNQAGGLFDIQNDQPIHLAYGNESFRNAGTVRKSAGTGTTSFNLPFTNTGTVEAQSGTISLNSGGDLGGTFVAAAGAAIHFAGGTFALVSSGPNSSGAGQVQFASGATITFSEPITNFNLNDGNLTGSNLVTGTLNWTGGTISGSLTVANGATLNINGDSTKQLFGPLTNEGGVSWSGSGSLQLLNNGGFPYAGSIINQAGGLFDIQNDQTISLAFGLESFQNAGTVRKSAGSGITALNLPFVNTGTVEAQSGTIRFNSGGQLDGTFLAAAEAAINFAGGTFPLVSTGPVSSGDGQVQFSSGAMITFSQPIGSFNLTDGNLTGSNVVGGTLNWTGGTISGSLTVANGATLNISGDSTKQLFGPLTNEGGVSWSGSGSLQLLNNGGFPYAGSIINQAGGLFDIQNDQTISLAFGLESFQNAGTVRKSAGSGITALNLPFVNTGTVEAQSGTIRFNSGGQLDGTFLAAAEAAINFAGGTFPLVSTGPVSSGDGQVQFSSGAMITFSQPIGSFNLTDGNLTGSNVVGGTLNWTGGTISGSLTVANGATLNISGDSTKQLFGPLTNEGGVSWSGSGSLQLLNNGGFPYAGSIINQAGGLFDIQNDQTISLAFGLESFQNAGTVRKSAGSGITALNLPFVNTGTVEAQSGTIRFNSGGQLDGTFLAAAEAAINFAGGTFPLVSTGPVSSGDGQVQFSSGAMITFSQPIGSFNLTDGNLTGSNVVGGTLNWTGGTISGSLTVANGATLNISGDSTKQLFGPLTNEGGVSWSGSGSLQLLNNGGFPYAGSIINQAGGLFDIQNDQTISLAFGLESFQNAGTVRKSAGSGITALNLPFVNTGTVEAQSGTIRFNSGGQLDGTFLAAAEAAINFAGGTFPLVSTGPVSSGDGQVQFSSGAMITFSQPIGSFNLTDGNLTGSNVVGGTLNWTGGTISGSLTVANGATLNISGDSTKQLFGPLTNEGGVSWSGSGSLQLLNNGGFPYAGSIINQAGGLFDIQNDQTISLAFGLESFQNAGTVRKSAGTGTSSLNVSFINTGTVQAQSGVVRFGGAYSQTDGILSFGIRGVNEFGQIQFAGDAPLSGTAKITLLSGYSLGVGDVFALVTYNPLSGAFSSFDFPAGFGWRTDYGPSVFTVTVTQGSVPDTTPPVITLLGSNPLAVECHTIFSDPGASAIDAVAGSVSVTAAGEVNANVPGTYTITYSATDPSVNTATATRTVNVVDITRPVITLNGANPLTVGRHSSFGDPGATANDACAGNIAVTTAGSVDTDTPGTYTLTYSATDPSGNIDTETRIVRVVDPTEPGIMLDAIADARIGTYTSSPEGTGALLSVYNRINTQRTLVQFDLTPIGINQVITNATLKLYADSNLWPDGNPGGQVMEVYRVTQPWLEDEVTWHQPGASASWATAGGDYVGTEGLPDASPYAANNTTIPDAYHSLSPQELDWDVTSLVQEWYAGTHQNYGLLLLSHPGNGLVFRSRENVTYIPVLIVNGTNVLADTTPPVVTLTGADPMTVECHTSFIDPGATATDAVAGSVSVTATASVNASVPGAYTITYSATDPSGNTATATRKVNVMDTTEPVISLNGANPVTTECHIAFVDPGATANDDCAGSVAVTTSGSVNANTPGSYTLSYTATDPNGNTATATRTVNVVDTTTPLITLNGANPLAVECHSAFTDPGATATDACAGSVAVTTSGSVDGNTPGTFTITYSATDPSGNTATATRTVNVVDTTEPLIALNGANPLTVECHGAFTDPGATANDACAGALAVATAGSVDVNTPGAYSLAYSAVDPSGNTTTARRIVNVVCSSGNTVVYQNDFESSAGAEWSDASRSTTPSGGNFLGEFANQTVSLALGDLPGHSTMTVSFDLYIIRSWDGNTIFFNDFIIGPDLWELNVTDGPTLLHTTFHNNPLGQQAYPDDHLAGVHPGLTGAVEIGSLGYTSPHVSPADSVYRITYTFAHTGSSVVVNFVGMPNQVISDESWGIDNVVAAIGGDTTPPVITLNGANPITVECRGSFIDPGATASDEVGGTVATTASGSVDPNTPGTYTITYSATDPSGNTATAARTVNVVDRTKPVVTLNGANPLTVECHSAFTDPDATATDNCAGSVAVTTSGSVNANTPGAYVLTYTATDHSGNTATTTRTVNVVDTTTPLITLNGVNPLTVECHSAFTDAGATATDTCAGSVAVTTSGSVNANTPGSYTLTFAATDLSGNTATATRTVNVVDTTTPLITLNGANPLTVECHSAFTDAGATATDTCVGSLAVTTSGSVNANTPGSYTLSYTATDPNGNTATATRTVNVVDTTTPLITLNGANPLTVECHSAFTDPDAIATDNCAGSVAVTTSGTVNVTTPGTFTITYSATDPSGNTATATRTVNVVDTTKPLIALIGANALTVECHSAFTDPGATATDACAGSLAVAASGSVDANTPGTYALTYTASDPSGNTTTASRTVNVVDTTKPVIALNGANSLTIECHSAFTDAGATATDTCAGSLAVTTLGSVDVNTPGTYTLTYTATDPSGNTTTATRTINVVDTTTPLITLNGANPLTVECNSAFTDPDALATDTCAGSVAVTTSGSVNANTPGSYTLTYTAMDPSGNTATATRTLNVVDTTKPVITLNGSNRLTVECHTAFIDPGATATDTCAGNVAVATAGGVDANIPGTYTLTYTASDPRGNMGSATRTVEVVDTTAPAITLIGASSLTVECHTDFVDPGAAALDDCAGSLPVIRSGNLDTATPGDYTLTYTATDPSSNAVFTTRFVKVVCTGSAPVIHCPQPIIVGTDTGQCSAIVSYVVTASPGAGVVCTPPSGSAFPPGVTTVECTATDAAGQTAVCAFTVTVLDQEPPRITSLTASPSVLSPPNNQLQDVNLGAVVTDNCQVASYKIVSVTCNESITEPAQDWEITGDLTVKLRASRSPKGSGRIYTITVECPDVAGNVSTRTVTVRVPLAKGKPAKPPHKAVQSITGANAP